MNYSQLFVVVFKHGCKFFNSLPLRSNISIPSPWIWIGYSDYFHHPSWAQVTLCDFKATQLLYLFLEPRATCKMSSHPKFAMLEKPMQWPPGDIWTGHGDRCPTWPQNFDMWVKTPMDDSDPSCKFLPDLWIFHTEAPASVEQTQTILWPVWIPDPQNPGAS